MGLRHRTPISVLREQRRNADLQAEEARAALPRRKESSSRRPPEGPHSQEASELVSERDLALLTRLRGRITAPSELNQEIQHDCQSLEDELRRLSQLNKRQSEKSAKAAALPAELILSGRLYTTPAQDDLPFQTLKIVPPLAGQSPVIQRLDVSLSDLSYYQKLEQELERYEQVSKAPALVDAQTLTAEEVQKLRNEKPTSKEERLEPELSEEAAAFMLQMLKDSSKGDETTRLPQNLVLSLLDT